MCLTPKRNADNPSDDGPLKRRRINEETFQRRHFVMGPTLGEGCFGVVRSAICKRTNEKCAIKTFKELKAQVEKTGLNYSRKHLNEVQMCQSIIPHPNIVRFDFAWIEDGTLSMRMELCAGTLAGFWKSRVQLTHAELRTVLSHCATGLDHLNKSNIAHLDIKEENILRTADGNYKLADFTVTADLTKGNPDRDFGDGRYTAPELLLHQASIKSDVLALGMTLAQVSLPYPTLLTKEECTEIKSTSKFPATVTKGLVGPLNLDAIIHSMIRLDVSSRPSAADLLLQLARPTNCSTFDQCAKASIENAFHIAMCKRGRSSLPVEHEHLLSKSDVPRPAPYPRMRGVVFHTDAGFYDPQSNRRRLSLGAGGFASKMAEIA